MLFVLQSLSLVCVMTVITLQAFNPTRGVVGLLMDKVWIADANSNHFVRICEV
jgi:hypothetical protein